MVFYPENSSNHWYTGTRREVGGSSVTCTLVNHTSYTWYWEDFRLQEYTRFSRPNGDVDIQKEIKPGQSTLIKISSREAQGLSRSCEAWVTYKTGAGLLEFHWLVPDWGGNSYHTYKLPNEFISIHNSAPGKGAWELLLDGAQTEQDMNSIHGSWPEFEWTMQQREGTGLSSRLDHFYTTDLKGELAEINGYKYEGIAGYVYPTSMPNTVPLWRFFNRETGDHFYTQDRQAEGATDYNYEAPACYLPSSRDNGAVPLYRLWGNLDHFYTTNHQGENATESGYQLEGEAGLIYSTQVEGTVPFYRWVLRRGY